MNDERLLEATSLEELADIPLSELIEPQDLDMPMINPQDVVLPYDYIEDLTQRGVIGEDRITIDNDSRFIDGPEREPSPFEQSLAVNTNIIRLLRTLDDPNCRILKS